MNHVKSRILRVFQLLVPIGALLLLTTGCESVRKYSLTHKLWETDDLSKYSEPADSPELALYYWPSNSAVLVEYEAYTERRSTIRRQAYLLQANRRRIAEAKKPYFLEPGSVEGMQPIPLLASPPTNVQPGMVCLPINNGRRFTIYNNGVAEGVDDLPVYRETFGTPTRILLTPFAVVGDTVMVGGVASLAGFYLWVRSGAPGV